MGTSTKRYQWFLFKTLVLTLYYQTSYGQSGSFGGTFVHTSGEMGIYGQHNFQTGSGTINAGIIGAERQPPIGIYSFVSPNGSWINASSSAVVSGCVETYNSDFTLDDGLFGLACYVDHSLYRKQ